MQQLTLLIHCPDQAGIIAATTNFIQSKGGNITYLDQHVDSELNVFFMRLECQFKESSLDLALFRIDFSKEIGSIFNMNWQLYSADYTP